MTCIFGVQSKWLLNYLAANYWNGESVLQFVVVFSWLTFLWDTYLSYRQYKVYVKSEKVPAELSAALDQETFSKARAYNLDKSTFGFASGTWSQCLTTAILLMNGIPYLWAVSGDLLLKFGYSAKAEIFQTLVFVVIGSLFSVIIDIPWSVYSTFVVEQRHGFNKQTPGFYVKDKIKKFFVMQAIMCPIISAAIYIIKIGGDFFFVFLWVFCFVVTIILLTVYPDYIAPLFDKFTPLPDGELRSKIEALATSIDFPLKKLYVVEGSKRSSHSNAYFFGFYKNKRIVLFDTLIEDYKPVDEGNADKQAKDDPQAKSEETGNRTKKGCNTEEVLAVLAHELGHWKLNHVLKNLIITEVNMFLCLMVFGVLYQNQTIFSAFGFKKEKPVFIGLLIIFQYIFQPYNEVLSFLMTCLSRRFEFGADAFAKHLNKATDLRSALIKLNKDNLSFPVNDYLYSCWYHSHPPLLERIKAIGKID